MPGKDAAEVVESEPLGEYGDMVPYADPYWYQGGHSPYFNESHAALRAEIRDWVEEKVAPYVGEWEVGNHCSLIR